MHVEETESLPLIRSVLNVAYDVKLQYFGVFQRLVSDTLLTVEDFKIREAQTAHCSLCARAT